MRFLAQNHSIQVSSILMFRNDEYTSIICLIFVSPLHYTVLAEVLRLILINVQKAHYGPTPQSNVGPCVYGEAYKIFYGSGDYATRLAITKKYPFQSAKYQRNQYTFANSLLPEKTGYLQHKCDGCDSSSMQDEWLGGGNDYRKLYENKQFYCKAASRIFLNVEPSQLKDQTRR
jgi:hypothetical protein